MNKYLIYYSPKSTPGKTGIFVIKVYFEDEEKFEGFEFDQFQKGKSKFNKSKRTVISKNHKYFLFETDNEKIFNDKDSVKLLFEMA